jgi:hypothetical protein
MKFHGWEVLITGIIRKQSTRSSFLEDHKMFMTKNLLVLRVSLAHLKIRLVLSHKLIIDNIQNEKTSDMRFQRVVKCK